MRISRFSQLVGEEISFALWENETIVELLVYKKNPSDSQEEAYKRNLIAANLDMMAADNANVTRREIEELIANTKSLKISFI